MKNVLTKFLAGFVYVVMVIVNFLANGLPINNRTTGEISDAYPNLFTPSGLTFSIWGVIYLLLGGYVVYQFLQSGKRKEDLFKKINVLFVGTSFANISWIFAWHYDLIGLSVIIMAILLTLLIRIADILRVEHFTVLEKFFILAPFSVYFGWITVAAIANVTVFFVSISWNGFGIPDFIWTSIILFVGAVIGILRTCKDQNFFYGLVLIWAYLGILFKHLSADGFDGQYRSIIITVIICLISFGFFVGRLLYKK